MDNLKTGSGKKKIFSSTDWPKSQPGVSENHFWTAVKLSSS